MYNRKKIQEEIPEVSTKIWSCENDDCNGWMRENFTFDSSPTCLLCNSPMTIGERMLPQIVNTNDIMKLKAVAATAE
ncbi:cold-shock protein [Paenibacillus sp. NEAU-GSW1]|uniref:cold-shock protein n=1 Tax=Paenibacillus sp. NEAU-GSW1 TaxID=2682486 RepID=UPI0012E1260F|nr:cold-shock protein [Paenibacillus sp. NEAU-GSW1]MUT66573.1 cold-shock protein [Paenibacillus sp. NEAU-GSW1]